MLSLALLCPIKPSMYAEAPLSTSALLKQLGSAGMGSWTDSLCESCLHCNMECKKLGSAICVTSMTVSPQAPRAQSWQRQGLQ